MDKNQATGLILIAVLLIAYWTFFKPELPPQEVLTEETVNTAAEQPTEETPEIQTLTPLPDSVVSADHVAKFGAFAAGATGTSTIKTLENGKLKVDFDSHGAHISNVILKTFLSKDGNPVQLINNKNNEFATTITSFGKPININTLYYTPTSQTVGDTSSLVFKLDLGEGRYIKHTYKLASEGYELIYKLDIKGLDNTITKDEIVFQWNDHMIPQEKDVILSRSNSTVNYYTVAGDFDEISERSTEYKEETVSEPIKWATIKQRFFLSAIIAENSFTKGEFSTDVDLTNLDEVKFAKVTLGIPFEDARSGKANYKFYFGPNDYHITGDVAEDFSKNLFLGWPPMLWVNKYVIIPLFDLLNNFLDNYGLIIILIVLAIKLVLSPLSYKSYLSMAKMKVLKPELDEIKAKHEGDASKAQQEQMKLYQQVGVNPISGCVPMLLQMPILLAMFYFFPQSIELRGQSFLWAEDLSTYDSILNLPFSIPLYGDHVSLFVLLMTVSTILITYSQQQVSSVQGPMKSLSYMMPVVFMFVLNSYPAALSFYYFVSNLVTFGQQTVIRKFVDEDKIRKILDENKKTAGSRKKSIFQQKLEDAMKSKNPPKGKNNKK
jgi:YidC/Oxa1 family membrane protein insertase